MVGMCGWLGPSGTGAPPEVSLAGMAAGLSAFASFGATSDRQSTADAAAGLHVDRHAPADGLHAGDDLWAAITGYPRWRDAGLAARARAHGHAAALAEAYRQRGADLLDGLLGHFSLAVIDRRANRALLAVDRAGVEPMCYGLTGGGAFVFGSTTDSVRAHPAADLTISTQAIFDFLYLYRVPAPRAIYREQSKLLPGSCVSFADGRLRTRRYWQMPYGEPSGEPARRLERQLLEELRAACRRIADSEAGTAIGTFLSGGLDSSTVTGVLAEISDRPVDSFTIGFDLDQYDESAYARGASEFYGTSYHSHSLTREDVADVFTRLVTAYDEPFGNSSVMPAYYCARLARDSGVEVMLAGDGGDELFGGNSRYLTMEKLELYQLLPRWLRKGMIEPALSGLPGVGRLRIGPRARGLIDWCNMPMPGRLDRFSYMSSAPWAEMLEPDFLGQVDPTEPRRLQQQAYDQPADATMLQRMMALDLQITLADCDLRKVNRACQVAGVRVRYPMLDDDLMAFAARLPSALINRHFRLRGFYKRSLQDFLPPAVLTKPKHGFGMPNEEWLKQPGRLRELSAESIAALGSRGIFRRSFIERMTASLRAASASSLDQILWDAVVLEQWLSSRAGGGGAAQRLLRTGT